MFTKTTHSVVPAVLELQNAGRMETAVIGSALTWSLNQRMSKADPGSLQPEVSSQAFQQKAVTDPGPVWLRARGERGTCTHFLVTLTLLGSDLEG